MVIPPLFHMIKEKRKCPTPDLGLQSVLSGKVWRRQLWSAYAVYTSSLVNFVLFTDLVLGFTLWFSNGSLDAYIKPRARLSVKTFIRAEAMPLVFQKNTVVLPNAKWTAQLFHNCLDSPEKRLWLRHLELQLCKSDMPASARDHLAHAHILASSSSEPHDSWTIIWPTKMAFILDDTNLTTLTVDMRGSFCPASCCACHHRALTSLRKGFANGKVPALCFKGVTRTSARSTEFILPARPDFDESDFANTPLPAVTVSAGSGEGPELRMAVRIGGQIARWTRPRGLGKGVDYGDYKWMMEEARLDDAHVRPSTQTELNVLSHPS